MHAPSIRPVPLSKIHAGKNVRTGPLDVEDLVESFDRGVPQLQNVVVRLRPKGGYELLAGHRRVEAARQMGWTTVDAKILDVDNVTAETFGLEENLRRKKLPNEAQAIARLVELHEHHSPSRRGGDRRSKDFKAIKRQLGHVDSSVGRVAKLTGQSERDVRRKAAIGRGAAPEVHAALRDGRINVLEAEKLSRLPVAEQARRVAQPDGDRDVKRALSALAFAERKLDAEVVERAQANPLDNFALSMKSKVESLMIERMDQNQEIVSKYLNEPKFQEVAFGLLVKRIHEELTKTKTNERTTAAGERG